MYAGHFKLIGSGKGLPVVAFALKDGRKDAQVLSLSLSLSTSFPSWQPGLPTILVTAYQQVINI